eukprot:CAMPEP_0204055270 /NCGR_PEP_ID=MMETSP0360-20130528/130157_1 /ASSEMBLY_ACC=CAM_ASM_000342 /TAXON_ID=268821 /ORGANISM="Scrippsiella Hangoei, Strain SHTV-5" /LENGTH=36 /DNA_ID= /DNA_START= /DNA_END= /DNA_ORIENTATION=
MPHRALYKGVPQAMETNTKSMYETGATADGLTGQPP